MMRAIDKGLANSRIGLVLVTPAMLDRLKELEEEKHSLTVEECLKAEIIQEVMAKNKWAFVLLSLAVSGRGLATLFLL